ncbi:MAG TPA: permease, partial [Longimicrobiales bacterium]|nr:permease [Longimicrobiales bacterium]
GGVVMIAVSALLIRLTYPRAWLEAAREKVEEEAPAEEEDFDWKERIRSRRGWRMVGRHFVSEWAMVWEEIVIGFTVAGFVAVLVPDAWWGTIFLLDFQDTLPGWLVVLENAAVAPFVAAATFIGSMGNIPLATVLDANGVLFAGIMGFIYSDLIVPPLVAVNARYYGWRVALYVAAVMYASILVTALTLHVAFGALGFTPEGGRALEEIARFRIDYTFWLNLVMAGAAVWLVWLRRRWVAEEAEGDGMDHEEGGVGVKRVVVWTAVAVVAIGALVWWTGAA